MSILKRLSATFISRIDQVVGEIENHDAVIQASLNEMSKKIAEAKVRINQANREKDRLKQQIQEKQQNTQRWRERAVDCAKTDENKALECVRRSRYCEAHAKTLELALAEYDQSIEKMARDIEAGERHFVEMKQKLTLMRARQSTNKVNEVSSSTDSNVEELLDDTFNRWEINISQSEMSLDRIENIDPIEREFITQEQQDDLRNELAALLVKGEQ